MPNKKQVTFNPIIDAKVYRTRQRRNKKIWNSHRNRKNRRRRKERQIKNRFLRNLEKEMRSIDLLFKDEYLKLRMKSESHPYKHSRGELINFVSHQRKWLKKNVIVKIVS